MRLKGSVAEVVAVAVAAVVAVAGVVFTKIQARNALQASSRLERK